MSREHGIRILAFRLTARGKKNEIRNARGDICSLGISADAPENAIDLSSSGYHVESPCLKRSQTFHARWEARVAEKP